MLPSAPPLGPEAAVAPLALQALGEPCAPVASLSGAAATPCALAQSAVSEDERRQQIRQGLLSSGVPFGLAHLVSTEDSQIALRIFLLDNSGSTAACDGKYLDTEVCTGVGMKMVTCSRWEELRRMAFQQATINTAMGTPCEFILLNPPRPREFAAFEEGVDFATVNPRSSNVAGQLGALQQMLQKTRPNGTTPLGERLREIHHRIQHVYGSLVSQGLHIVVVVATDGLPTSGGSNLPSDYARREVEIQLRQLTSQLPVFIVVRLTTDEDPVVAYYNQIDAEDELALEVIDDIESEAQEASQKGNGWLIYSPLIHMIREGGTHVKLFDALDERQFKPAEVKLLAGHVLQSQEYEDPLPTDDVEFCQSVRNQLTTIPLVYDPLLRQMAPCIHVQRLRAAIGISNLTACFRCFRMLGSQTEARAPLMSG